MSRDKTSHVAAVVLNDQGQESDARQRLARELTRNLRPWAKRSVGYKRPYREQIAHKPRRG